MFPILRCLQKTTTLLSPPPIPFHNVTMVAPNFQRLYLIIFQGLYVTISRLRRGRGWIHSATTARGSPFAKMRGS
jgi:hypothetical protein